MQIFERGEVCWRFHVIVGFVLKFESPIDFDIYTVCVYYMCSYLHTHFSMIFTN